VLSVTYIKGGKFIDATPPVVEFGGTLRSLTTEGLYRLQKRLQEVSIMAQLVSLRVGI
jgi:IAA-amino acid hydrolase